MYDGDHLQGRLQLSDEGEEECIKEKMTVRAKQAAVFLHKKSYREWHCWGENDSSSHQKIKLWSKSYFCVSDNFKTFSDWAQVQSKEGEVQRRQDSCWHLQGMQSKNYDDFESEFDE